MSSSSSSKSDNSSWLIKVAAVVGGAAVVGALLWSRRRRHQKNGSGHIERQRLAYRLTRPSATMNVILVRHAQSTNNLLANELRQKYIGASPYASAGQAAAEYEERRSADPKLTEFGRVEAENLIEHPYFQHILPLQHLTAQKRVKLFSSPFCRAIETAIPLANKYDLRVHLKAELCEQGGYYSTKDTQGGARGLTRAQFEEMHPNVDASEIGVNGWWNAPPGVESPEHYDARVRSVVEWLRRTAFAHCQAHHLNSPLAAVSPDYLMIVAHADFLNTLMQVLLQMDSPPQYTFIYNNTSVSHIHLEFHPTEDNKPNPHEMFIRVQALNARSNVQGENDY